jgi:hypothetical protein
MHALFVVVGAEIGAGDGVGQQCVDAGEARSTIQRS